MSATEQPRRVIQDQRGQSLLEMLIAVFILVAATTATLTLIISSINAGKESRSKMIATSLAREGVELVRNIRDSNWIDPSPLYWDTGISFCPSTCDPTAVPTVDEVNPMTLNFAASSFTDAAAAVKLSANRYLQNTAAGSYSTFYRLIYITQICQDAAGAEKLASAINNTDACNSGDFVGYPTKVGIRVVSEVRWPSPAGRKVQVEDRLYNWQVL
ncbi:MAG: hypothetical protein V1916_01295 [Patescibacteria group bacterium]